MEIDITSLVLEGETWDFSGSAATHGPNAGPNTWANAKREAAERPLLKTEDELQALRDHVEGMGFGEEVQGYGADECNALFIQLVSGDMREMGLDECEPEDFDWEAHEELAQAGNVSGNIFRCDIPDHASFGRYFYYLGS